MATDPQQAEPRIFLVTGVTGTGKTTIGQALAKRLNLQFADADDYHPESNKRKMAAGHPLTDEDRQPWLETLHQVLLGWHSHRQGGILACSALKQKYRETLSGGLPSSVLCWVLLDLPHDVLSARLTARHHEFMNPALLQSQLNTLEPPARGAALCIVNDRAPADVIEEILQKSHNPAQEHHGTSSL